MNHTSGCLGCPVYRRKVKELSMSIMNKSITIITPLLPIEHTQRRILTQTHTDRHIQIDRHTGIHTRIHTEMFCEYRIQKEVPEWARGESLE